MSIFQITGGAIRLYGVLIPNRGSCVSFADDFNDLFVILFLLSGFTAQHSRVYHLFYLNPLYFILRIARYANGKPLTPRWGRPPSPQGRRRKPFEKNKVTSGIVSPERYRIRTAAKEACGERSVADRILYRNHQQRKSNCYQ